MITFFRGKAATGKSTMAKYIANQHDIAVLDKDSVFDKLLNEGVDWETANNTTYDRLVQDIQWHHDNNIPAIVDIGLSHTPFFEGFLKKMSLSADKVRLFLFTCSDDLVWESRILARIENPEGPNQCIWSTVSAHEHYAKYDIYPLEGENIIDSVVEKEEIYLRVMRTLRL
ncbi:MULTISPECIES: AAA family ATPase [unclassified Fusibacter]|uniref:AAA family ATPase n=1 Tax=unclassified Fusibacter TaxID=2624464 RepID=UPI001012D02A|nr:MULTISPECIES: AAA family ATPase [unclassified Fusibacter]MCK8060275.1 AAA family ATPase [Fusibacter sp. A2]NPE20436.1 AAA family ATPase [Fusibacter sp. A1]RXV63641.1 hypothetical protein DWB64_01300 [Fusibacter sp. A1]